MQNYQPWFRRREGSEDKEIVKNGEFVEWEINSNGIWDRIYSYPLVKWENKNDSSPSIGLVLKWNLKTCPFQPPLTQVRNKVQKMHYFFRKSDTEQSLLKTFSFWGESWTPSNVGENPFSEFSVRNFLFKVRLFAFRRDCSFPKTKAEKYSAYKSVFLSSVQLRKK